MSMAAKASASAAARHGGEEQRGEYSLQTSDGSSGQEWILEAYRALEPGNYLREFTSRNVRPDGRPLSVSRPVAALPSVLTRNSHGSAMISLGGGRSRCTRVIAACTLLVGQPGASTPDDGDIDVTLTASPLSGPRFDIMGRESGDVASGDYGMGSDGAEGKSLAGNLEDVVTNKIDSYGANATLSPTDVKDIESWVRRTLRSSRFVNPKELGIEKGVSAWRVRISMHILNHEGNVWDASLLCACAALADLRLPMVEIEKKVVRIVKDENIGTDERAGVKVRRRKGRMLALGSLPVPLTMAILPNTNEGNSGGKNKHVLLVDPTHLEEGVASGNMLTVVCNTNEEIVELHKKGSGSRLTTEQVAAAVCMGFGRARELERLVQGR